jgi:hypothetical protein
LHDERRLSLDQRVPGRQQRERQRVPPVERERLPVHTVYIGAGLFERRYVRERVRRFRAVRDRR